MSNYSLTAATAANGAMEDDSSSRMHYGHLHFGVVGEGRGKKILAFGSSNLSDVSDVVGVPWTCGQCNYENADSLEQTCSMCGAQSSPQINSIRSASSLGTSSLGSMPSVTEGSESFGMAPPRRGMPKKLSSLETSLRQMVAKRVTAIDECKEEITVESLQTDAMTSTVDMTRNFADVSISDLGGWTCPDCTFVNTDSMHLTCGVCGREKPPKTEAAPMPTQSSFRSFLSSSIKGSHSSTSFVGAQVEAYLQFEKMTAEKDSREKLLRQTSEVIGRASKRRTSHLERSDMIELRGVLEEGEETLKSLESFYADEKSEYAAMVELQAIRAQEIEQKEGEPPQDMLLSKASRPGVQRISAEILEWHGQQRMLDDWKLQLEERKDQIKQMQAQQKEALTRLLG